ncbi:MAG: EAL domain-containing protein, partial [Arenimonas sp.]
MNTSAPNNPKHSGSVKTATSDNGPAAGLLFLVAEDHEFQRDMLVEMIEGLGARGVHEAIDGRAALEIMRELDQPYDIIVTDINMPGMDGMAFIRSLAEAGVDASLIITSSLDQALLNSIETMSIAYGVRFLGTLQKPVTTERLAELVSRHVPTQRKQDRKANTGPTFSVDEVLEGLQNEEFEPFFQPKIELATNKVKGAEALVRWRHPQKGIIAPYAFIELLESHDQIGELTWIMLAKS